MIRFILWRLLQAIPVIFIVITATFFLVRSAPGGPFDSEKAVLPEVKRALEAQYKLDLPLHEPWIVTLCSSAWQARKFVKMSSSVAWQSKHLKALKSSA